MPVTQVQAGLLKPIATTYNKRISAYPSLPTTAEQGYPTVEIGHWAGLLAPLGTPQPVIDKMNGELQAALKSLRNSGINIVAIHHHMVGEEPRMIFFHYWGRGPAKDLANAVKAALKTTGTLK